MVWTAILAEVWHEDASGVEAGDVVVVFPLGGTRLRQQVPMRPRFEVASLMPLVVVAVPVTAPIVAVVARQEVLVDVVNQNRSDLRMARTTMAMTAVMTACLKT
jgi:hypothetical protein